MAENNTLTSEQCHTLFDILTHFETYKEIQDFKHPGAISRYGPPFQNDIPSSQSPILQSLLAKFVLKLPGLSDVSPEFWTTNVEKLIDQLAAAELSESYDKGVVGIRKTLATAIAALIEYPARGALGGFSRQAVDPTRQYDTTNPDEILQAWQDAIQEVVYGDLIDKIFEKVAETPDLSKHDSLTQALHEFILVNIASLMHYTVVLSPEGPTLLHMMENVNKLLPYLVIRQTLKIGNVATMLSGMMRVVLAKVSVATVTNWIGLSSGANEGMNLMQQIISQVLYWDRRELKKRADKIEKDQDAPPREVREELKAWIQRSREEHEECRTRSRDQNMSIVAVILAFSPVSTDLTEAQHAKAMEYLALHLSIRDRIEIVQVLCHSNPDLLTAAVKSGVEAYTPIIRHVHQAVDLSDTVSDFERFVTDLLRMTKSTGRKDNSQPPSVQDFVDLLHRHQSSCHKFLHQVFKNGKELTMWWKDYAHMAVAQFRNDQIPPQSAALIADTLITNGGIDCALNSIFSKLSEADRLAVTAELSCHKEYVEKLHAASAARISSVINRTGPVPFGPGAYLARWQHLMDSTPITPATAEGPVRYGSSKSVQDESRQGISGAGGAESKSQEQALRAAEEKLVVPPDVNVTLRSFAGRFKEVLASS